MDDDYKYGMRLMNSLSSILTTEYPSTLVCNQHGSNNCFESKKFMEEIVFSPYRFPDPKFIKHLACSTQLSMKFKLLIITEITKLVEISG